MLIHFDQVRREPVSWDETVEVGTDRLDRDEVLALTPVRWRGRISVTEAMEHESAFYLKARLSYEQTLACQRCLEPVREPVEAEVGLVLLRGGGQPLQGEHQLDEEELGVAHVEGETFDTWPLLLEQMQLAVPMKPLCREDCKGLCPDCGANRNTAPCDCEDDRVDPRWAALQKLKSEG